MKKPNIQQRKCSACHPLAMDTLPLINSFVDYTVFYVDGFMAIFIQDSKCKILAEVRAVASLEDAKGHQHLAGGHGGGCEQMSPFPPWGSGGRDPRILLYIFHTKSCILVHSLAPKMDNISVFIKTLCIGGKENCRKRLLNEARRAENRSRKARSGGVLREGQQAPPANGSGSDVNKTKFLRPKPRPK